MNLLHYKRGLLSLLVILSLTAIATAVEVKKEFHQEYKADKNTILTVNNRYGEVIFESWDKNQIVIDVVVTVEMPSEDQANKVLDLIDISMNQEGANINAETTISDRFSFKGWGGSSKRFNIDYRVKMPADVTVNVINRYGNIEIGDHSGQVSVNLKYGNLAISSLTRKNEKPLNSISLAYGKANINIAGWLEISTRYSSMFEIGEVQAVTIDSRYSKLRIDKVSSAVIESKYDNITITNIKNISAETAYTGITLGNLTGQISLEARYGSFSVTEVEQGFESIDIDGAYCSIKLGVDPTVSYRFAADLSYAGLKMDESNFNYSRKIVENNSRSYEGIVGDGKSPKSKVYIKSSYGSVRID